MLARIFQHADMLVTALLTPFPVLSMTFDHLSPLSRNPNMNPVKHSLPIDVITSLIAKIAETNHDTEGNVALSATKKAVGLRNTQRKNRKIQRDDSRNDSRNDSPGISTDLPGNISLNMKELTIMMITIVKKTK